MLRIPRGTVDAARCFVRAAAAYRKLETWQVSMDFVEQCYKATARFPREEMYGLTSQIRRAAVSVPSNVAEGYCRRKTKVYLHYVRIALGSHAELETCIEIASRLGLLSSGATEPLQERLRSVGRLLYRLHESLEEKIRLEENSPRVP